jgi:hypothetical protein
MRQTCMQCGSFADNGKICDDCVEKNERSFRSTRPFSAEQQAIIDACEKEYLEEHGEDYDPTP